MRHIINIGQLLSIYIVADVNFIEINVCHSVLIIEIYHKLIYSGEDQGEEGSTADLRNSVASLVEAMRDLLSNIYLPEMPGDGDNEDDPDSDEQDAP